ncbi:MAG: polynucleotide adenylyltransferase PcnB, partial [Bdellovibrionales bacterium]|nr:polynucleotide adenylyltransferase PcnB [Bdellovibrionales bacterium]
MSLSEVTMSPTIYSRSQHNISRSAIDKDALKIMYRLLRHNYEAFLVGGGVRDLLLEKEPKDFDISTDATPNQIRSLFRNCRIIGRRFKLAHIYFRGGKIIEVSTFRDESAPIDVQDDEELRRYGRDVKRDNRYGTAETDAFRRDITINGLFYDLSNFSVIDYVGGMSDLRAKIIRVIGNPDERFQEDPVRMLRVIRHAARAK